MLQPREVTLSLLASVCLSLIPSPAASSVTFTQTCFAGSTSPALAVADFNHDGNLDVALSPDQPAGSGFTVNALVDVYLGDGTGAFTFATQLSTGAFVLDMAAGDVNGDGNVDLVTGGDPISLLLGNGDGTFQAAQSVAGGGDGLALGDVNQDGFPDLITAEDKEIIVSVNLGNGTFGTGQAYNLGEYARGVTTSDLNGDGYPDLVALTIGNKQNAGVSVLMNKTDGKFGHVIRSNVSGGFPGRNIGAGDFNGDGNIDLAAPFFFDGGVSVILGDGHGSFGAPTSYPMAGSTYAAVVGDVDGDSDADIVAGNYVAGKVTVLSGNGSGSFSVGNPIPVAYGLSVALADVNADSRLDILEDSCVLLNNGPAPATAAIAALRTQTIRPEAGTKLTATFSPNPVATHGALAFRLPEDARVSVHLYDLRGRRVQTLMDEAWLTAGSHSLELDRRATGLESGVYFYRVEAVGQRAAGSVVILGH